MRSTTIFEKEEWMRKKTYLSFAAVSPVSPSPSVLSGTSNKTFRMKRERRLLGSVGAQTGKVVGTEMAVMFESLAYK